MKFTIFFGISFFLLLLCSLRLLQIANIGQEKLQASEQGLLPRPPESSFYIPNRQSSVQERSGDVELSAPGLWLPLEAALDIGWSPPPPVTVSPDTSTGPEILVAVTSCSVCAVSAARRAAARSTWVRQIAEQNSNIDVKFVLAQPSPAGRKAALRDLRPEAELNGDLVVVRGTEEYRNLPNKTLRLLRYALSGIRQWTHVLKTDDDCYVRGHALLSILRMPAGSASQEQYRCTGVYTGCLENVHGFYPLRNPDSKWYISYEEMPDEVVPWARRYLAGWGYLLSADVALHIVNSTLHWEHNPEEAPGWYSGLHWEDVMVGLVAGEVVGEEPQANDAFVPAWKGCTVDTAVRHLDVEAPKLFQMLYELETSGAWQAGDVPCTEGDYAVNDYWSWKNWRDGLEGVLAIGEVG
ncbi:g3002 [Coccomyxa elongata]